MIKIITLAKIAAVLSCLLLFDAIIYECFFPQFLFLTVCY